MKPTKQKHTPGPWKIIKATRDEVHLPQAPRSSRFVGMVGPNGLPVAEVHTGNIDANARLIACAPELLEALKRIVDTVLTDDRLMNACNRGQARSLLDAAKLITRAERGAG